MELKLNKAQFSTIFFRHYKHSNLEDFAHRIHMTGQTNKQTISYLIVFIITMILGFISQLYPSDFTNGVFIGFTVLYFLLQFIMYLIIHLKQKRFFNKVRINIIQEYDILISDGDIRNYIKTYLPLYDVY